MVTGAGRGIGRAIALAFAGEGARVVVTGRNTERLAQVVAEIRALGGEAEAFALDVTREEDAARVVEQVIGAWGRIDVLVNNAGVIIYDVPVWATTVEQWDELMNTNLRGMFLTCRAVAPHMMAQERGLIINIGSSSGRVPEGDYGGVRRLKVGSCGLYGLSGALPSSSRHTRQRHQPGLGGYGHGQGLQP